MIEVIEDTKKLNIITEICKGGELFEIIMNCTTFSEILQPNICIKCIQGL